jgi:hypothetical protein
MNAYPENAIALLDMDYAPAWLADEDDNASSPPSAPPSSRRWVTRACDSEAGRAFVTTWEDEEL